MSTIQDILDIARRHDAPSNDDVPRLKISRSDYPTEPMSFIWKPAVCLVLQGAKRMVIGNKTLEYGAGDCMIVAAEVAAMVQISQAKLGRPYLAANLYLDPAMISALLVDMAGIPEPVSLSGFNIAKAPSLLLDAWRRFVELLDRPEEIPIMATRFEQEVLLRLLMGPQGFVLRQLARPDSRLGQIRRAMEWIRERHAERITIGQMAAIAGMSPSVFHRRFKAITELSPLQYQKHIRLNEARRQIITDGSNAASVGFSVGYESPSQFSREYKRLFGEPPRRDAAALQSILES
ncbi:AraC family transcriptional regulator N-terminal domain-containing protein [Bradyrhizobium genosp. P]|uniref:AraC family transcriptional regulator n=1 Tax=Bradyrhizobium genosp. P TaxID=83641 RepID=UPI003CEFDE07